jgi:hypothetical protein
MSKKGGAKGTKKRARKSPAPYAPPPPTAESESMESMSTGVEEGAGGESEAASEEEGS